MKRIAICLCIVPLLAACGQQELSRRDRLSEQFAQMNRGGFSVDDKGRPQPTAGTGDPNVRVIHAADFSGFTKFYTNLQTSDPRAIQVAPAMLDLNDPDNPAPVVAPFGPAPAAALTYDGKLMIRFIAIFAASLLLAACASEDGPRSDHVSYGPSNTFFSPSGTGGYHGTEGTFAPTDEHYRAATPPPFRGF